MSDAAAGVFISYRRQEANYLAGWLHDRLAAHFGEARVFLDIDWIKPGLDFMQVITEAIARSRSMLVLIGPQWLAPEEDGRRRLDQPDDPVRVELETAFRQGLRVIPLVLEGATMPRAGDLPATLAGLTRLNALRVGYQSFRSDVTRLIQTLTDDVGIIPTSGLQTAELGVELRPEPRRTMSTNREAARDVGRDAEQRARLLSRLSRTYTEYLTQSLEHDALLKLQLDLDWLPGKTVRPQDRLLPVQRHAERLLAGTSLLQAFDRAGGLAGDGLLVLGEPGAGKTTLLFELARRLTERAHTDPRHPVPVYLPLSSWATRRPRLDQWLVEQLGELYQIPRPLARRWTTGTELLFVLDGLDEIPDRDDRTACVKAINRFTRFGRSTRLPVVVASRPTEYDTLPVQLQLETAIGVRPLDPTTVLDGLRHAPGMQAVVTAVQHDPELLDLLRTPLLVSMLTLTYTGAPETQIHALTASPAERRRQLITDYVHRRFELDRLTVNASGGRGNPYPPDRTQAWLSALALYLAQHQQTVLLLGRLQLDWLPTRWARWLVITAPGLLVGLALSLLVFFVALSASSPEARTLGALIIPLSSGLGAGLGAVLVGGPQPAERMSWSWTQGRARLPGALIAGVAFGLIFGIGTGLRFGLTSGLAVGLAVGLGVGLGAGVIGGISGLRAGLGAGLGVALILGVPVGLAAGLAFWIFGSQNLRELAVGMALGLCIGLFAGLCAGLVGPPQPTERLSWSWSYARSRVTPILIAGVVFGLLVGLFGVVYAVGLRSDLTAALTAGLRAGLIGGSIFVLVLGLSSGMSRSLIPSYATPNEGIRRSIRNGLVVALISGVVFWLVFELGLKMGLIYPLVLGAIPGLVFGLGAAAQHGFLRLLLCGYRVTPMRYVRWLNYTVRLRLLYRGASGGYLFIHRIVQDYFREAVLDHPSQDEARS